MEDKKLYEFIERRRLERKKKSRNAFNLHLQNLSTKELNNLLNVYQGMDFSIIRQQKIDDYYKLDDSIKKDYKKLLNELEKAQEKLDYLDSADPYLYQLWHLGEVTYYYNGSPRQIVEAENKVNEIELKIKSMENKYPELRYANEIYNTEERRLNKDMDLVRQRKIFAIKRELITREQNNEIEK